MKKYFACLALFAAVMYVGCSDYLDEFKDEYEGQFAQKVDDPKDDEMSSDSHDPVMSSGVENNKNSSDSKDLKSSSSGKGSSSGSSSSVAGGDAANRCGGTVIYDASVDPDKSVFGSSFEYSGRDGEGGVSAGKDGLIIELVSDSYALLNFGEVKDISSWEGICIEYTADGSTGLNFILDHEKTPTEAAAYFPVPPASEFQKYEAVWKNAEKTDAFDMLDFGQVAKFYFEGGEQRVKLIVSKITTIADDVDFWENSSSLSSSSSQVVCDGTVIYENGSNNVGTGFMKADETDPDIIDGKLVNSNSRNLVWLMLDKNRDFEKKYDVNGWGGLCVDYESDVDILMNFGNYKNFPKDLEMAYVVLDKGTHVVKLPWDKWKNISGVLGNVNVFEFGGNASSELNPEHGKIAINKITTINKDVDLYVQSNVSSSSSVITEAQVLSSGKCPGTEIYNNGVNRFGYEIESWGLNIEELENFTLTKQSNQQGVELFFADVASGESISVEPWGGICVEYSSDAEIFVSLALRKTSGTGKVTTSSALVLLPEHKSDVAYAIPLSDFQDEFNLFPEPIDFSNVNRIAFFQNADHTTQVSVIRITTLNSVVLQ